MRDQAAKLQAEGVVGVRLSVEHHKWRGGHQVAKIVAIGTAVAFDHAHSPDDLRGAPTLHLRDGRPFTSALSGQDFVTLLRAGYRPVSISVGCCVYELNGYGVWPYAQAGRNEEIAEYTQALSDAREVAMERMTQDLFAEHGLAGAHAAAGHPDAPVGVVGMKVSEDAHAGNRNIIEYTAIGTAVAHLQDGRSAGGLEGAAGAGDRGPAGSIAATGTATTVPRGRRLDRPAHRVPSFPSGRSAPALTPLDRPPTVLARGEEG